MVLPLSSEEEAAIPMALVQSLREGRALALVGSGLSIPLGFPSWCRLIEMLCDSVDASIWRKDDQSRQFLVNRAKTQPEWVAEILRAEQPDTYSKTMRELFSRAHRAPASFAHAVLAILGFRGYATTNYDTTIEDYVGVFDLNSPHVLDHDEAAGDLSFINDGSGRFVLKLHGCATRRPDGLILTSTDYYKLMHDVRYSRMLGLLFQQFPILCLGFSLQDRDLRRFIEERYHLYADHCPPMYAVVGEGETCRMEVDTYYKRYNLQLVTVSETASFSELTSLLLSLYCLVHRVDSSSASPDICNTLEHRLKLAGIAGSSAPARLTDSAKEAWRLLAVLDDPVPLQLFTTLCTDRGIALSPAHYRVLGCSDNDGRIRVQAPLEEPLPDDRRFVARWLKHQIESIPITEAPRYLSTYHKETLDEFRNTISTMLLSKECWHELIGFESDALPRFHRMKEYFRQEGLWNQWLRITEQAQSFFSPESPLFIEMIRSRLWVLFWTRRYEDALELLERYPEADNKEGESFYRERIKYMDAGNLAELVSELEAADRHDHFSLSLLGRAYARLATRCSDPERRTALLEQAKVRLVSALELANQQHDLIETSVQSWYLACVHADLGEIVEAAQRLAEVRRLDECIMDRVPGIAWLRVAEYRLEAGNPEAEEASKQRKRERAITAMSQLGTVKVEEFVDEDYYY